MNRGASLNTSLKRSPFDLTHTEEYAQWRDQKLQYIKYHPYTATIKLSFAPPTFLEFSTAINQKDSLLRESLNALLHHCHNNGYAFYTLTKASSHDAQETKKIIHALMHVCGMHAIDHNLCAGDDHLSTITPKKNTETHHYIPYTTKPLSWHTDGYYNTSSACINTMLLHCYQPASNGGESCFLDHEMVYLLMRDENPAWIKALSHPETMTIPANKYQGTCLRAQQTGPVFSCSALNRLQMRYSARMKNIVWRDDKLTHEAREYIRSLLNSDTPYIVQKKLQAGEGVLSRNVLHNRKTFTPSDEPQSERVLFRGRYYNELPSSLGDNESFKGFKHVLG